MTVYREITKEESWTREYEYLVDYICKGYEEIIYEYTNDLACRLFIQESIEKNSLTVVFLEDRIKKADERLRSVLLKTNVCIHGKCPKSYFWLWGIPKNSNELMDEAKARNWI